MAASSPTISMWIQAKLEANRVERCNGQAARHPSLLAGLLFDDHGVPMTPSHAVKNGKRYRYYVSRSLTTGNRADHPTGRRLPAGDIEGIVCDRLRTAFADQAVMLEAIATSTEQPMEQERLMRRATEIARDWGQRSPAANRALVRRLVARAQVLPDQVEVQVAVARMADYLEGQPENQHQDPNEQNLDGELTLSIPAVLKRAGQEIKILVDAGDHGQVLAVPDTTLIKLIVTAHRWHRELIESHNISLLRLAQREGVSGSYFTRVLRLAFLCPKITRAILDGRQPIGLTAAKIIKTSRLPLNWREQRTLLGF